VSASTEESASIQQARTESVSAQADPRRWWSLIAVSLATFMTYLEGKCTCVKVGRKLTARA